MGSWGPGGVLESTSICAIRREISDMTDSTTDWTAEVRKARKRYDLADAQVQVEVLDRIDAGRVPTVTDLKRADELIRARESALRSWLDAVATTD